MADKQARPVLAAIARVSGRVGAVEKKGRNDFHRYEFATAADIMHRLQPLMAAEELVIIPTVESYDFVGDGQAMLMMFTFNVAHSSGDELGASPRFPGLAVCRNSKGGFDDKAANKCLTGAMKYFLLNLFKIPTGDYHDGDEDEDRAAPAAAPQSPPQRRQPPKVPRQAASAANGTKADSEPFDDPLPGPLADTSIEYINSHGEPEEMPLDVGIRKLRAAHKAVAKLTNDQWFELYKANEGWLTEHAPDVASDLSVRGG